MGLTLHGERPWLLAYALLVTEARNNQTIDFLSVVAYADDKAFNMISKVSSNFRK